MRVLGLDFETTFTDPIDGRKARIIEAGAVLWDTKRHMPLRIFNQVCWLSEYGDFDPRITELTGLTLEDLTTYGKPPERILDALLTLMGESDAVVAHNGNQFDRPVFEEELKRHGMSEKMPTLPWVDTTSDIPFPSSVETRKLAFLAPAHGFLNPFSHRAVFDVLAMLKVMSFYDFEEIARRAASPKVKLRAFTQKPWEDAGKSNQLAKDRGFRFDGASKMWTKTVISEEVERELKPGPLRVEVIK